MRSLRLTRITAGFGLVITAGSMFYAGSPSDPAWWIGVSVFGTWALLPYITLLLLSWFWERAPTAQVLLAIAAIIITAPVPFALYDGLIAPQHSTGPLIILFIPFYQLFVVVPLSLAAWWAARKHAAN